MLAIISDLHFCDGSATEKNVHPKAFALALEEIYDQARWLAEKRGKADLDLVLLGDVFDLLRTERWFEDRSGASVPLSERPWGTADALAGARPSAAVLERARGILAEVVAQNDDALSILRGESACVPPPNVDVRRILLMGNHDRLALHDEALHAGMRKALGAVDEGTLGAEGIYLHRLEMPQYNLLARHGHEWDHWNFESFRDDASAADYTDEEYLPAPIGDPITTELAARLPFEIKKRLADSPDLSDEEKLEIYHRMQHIEDVRPVFASLPWIYQEAGRLDRAYGAEKARVVQRALEDATRHVVGEFRNLDFFKAWSDKHHRLFRLDPPKQLGLLLDALSIASVNTVAQIAQAVSGSGDDDGARYRAGAAREARVGDKGFRFVVYGHTHGATRAALSAGDTTEDAYLNTGTFRRRVYRTEDKSGYVSSEYLSYLCFFREDEAATWRGADPRLVGPGYLEWTGTRSR